MHIGIDFGSSVTDAVLVEDRAVRARVSLHRPGPANLAVLRQALEGLGPDAAQVKTIAVSSGRSRELPVRHEGARIVMVDEPAAVGRGGLALTGLAQALVVSCGTGTAMIAAEAARQRFEFVTGTPVGGGTLEGLGSRLLGLRDASAIAELASHGDAGGVDTTLADVLGAGVGHLPPSATAASLARLATLEHAPPPEDLAAGLVSMVAQTIALIAVNGARANALPEVVFVGRLAEFAAVRTMIEAVFRVYGFEPSPRFPEGAAVATALGAALGAAASEA